MKRSSDGGSVLFASYVSAEKEEDGSENRFSKASGRISGSGVRENNGMQRLFLTEFPCGNIRDVTPEENFRLAGYVLSPDGKEVCCGKRKGEDGIWGAILFTPPFFGREAAADCLGTFLP